MTCAIPYRSPHLLSLRERISIDGQPIAGQHFDQLVRGGLEAAAAAPSASPSSISHFEMMTALALRHFQQQKVHRLARCAAPMVIFMHASLINGRPMPAPAYVWQHTHRTGGRNAAHTPGGCQIAV